MTDAAKTLLRPLISGSTWASSASNAIFTWTVPRVRSAVGTTWRT